MPDQVETGKVAYGPYEGLKAINVWGKAIIIEHQIIDGPTVTVYLAGGDKYALQVERFDKVLEVSRVETPGTTPSNVVGRVSVTGQGRIIGSAVGVNTGTMEYTYHGDDKAPEVIVGNEPDQLRIIIGHPEGMRIDVGGNA